MRLIKITEIDLNKYKLKKRDYSKFICFFFGSLMFFVIGILLPSAMFFQVFDESFKEIIYFDWDNYIILVVISILCYIWVNVCYFSVCYFKPNKYNKRYRELIYETIIDKTVFTDDIFLRNSMKYLSNEIKDKCKTDNMILLDLLDDKRNLDNKIKLLRNYVSGIKERVQETKIEMIKQRYVKIKELFDYLKMREYKVIYVDNRSFTDEFLDYLKFDKEKFNFKLSKFEFYRSSIGYYEFDVCYFNRNSWLKLLSDFSLLSIRVKEFVNSKLIQEYHDLINQSLNLTDFKICSKCGTKNKIISRFCNECGVDF